ncbi:MAG: BMP family ABC transporter substrate-binding protein [Lachnospiraceae bacterium]|nr:BMP family ABC transporter substrate-binding protein [Lachnospiraceae bacterium]
MKKVCIIAGIIIVAIIAGIFVIKINETDTEVTDKTTKVGLILNGSKADKNWCQSHYEGLNKTAEELNLAITCKEYVTDKELVSLVDELVADGCEIIVANSIEFGAAIEAAAEKYPEIYFFHATGVGVGRNLSSYFGRIYQIRYLCGIVAGLQTETNEIGYVAAFPIPEVNRGINAFTLGVKKVNPDATVYVRWTNSWIDDDATGDATTALLDAHNIDVLAMHTDSVRPLDIAESRGVETIGYNVDNSEFYPGTYLTAAVWDWEKFYTPNILKCLQGKFEGYHYWEGIDSGMISLAPFTEKVKDDTQAIVDRETELLKSGTFDVFYGEIVDNKGNVRIAANESMTDNALLNEFDWYVEGVVIDEE